MAADPGNAEETTSGGTFVLLLRGQASIACAGGTFDLDAGSWLALDARWAPELRDARDALMLALTVDEALLAWLRGLARAPIFFAGAGCLQRRDRRVALRIWRQAAGRQGGSLQASSGTGQALLRFIHERQAGAMPDVAACPGHSPRQQRETCLRFQHAKLLIDANPGRALRVSALASEAGVSLWYFSKVFHALYGISPQRYSMKVRLARACSLLAGQDLAIADVGLACGFENPCGFARAFRAHYGETASAYRSRHRALDGTRGAEAAAR